MSKVTDYAVKSSPAADDLIMIVDVHDASEGPQGTTKRAALGTLPFGAPVVSVNGHEGAVTLTAADVGADASGLSAAETTRAETAEALAAQKSANLADLASASAARSNLGVMQAPSGTAVAGSFPRATGTGGQSQWFLGKLYPSGDTSGAIDTASILAAITPAAGTIPAAELGAGTFWLSQTIAALANSTAVRGAGMHTTRITAVAPFTGTDMMDSGGFQYVTFEKLSLVGPAGSLGGGTQLNGLRKRTGARFTGRDIYFTGLNGLGFYTDASGNDSMMTLDNLRIQNCAGGYYLHGTHAGQVPTIMTACNWATPMGTTTGPAAGLSPFQVEDYWDLECFGMAPHVIKGNCVSCTFLGVDQAPPDTTTPATLIEDGANGSPLGIIIGDGILQDGSIGVRITGGASKITLKHLQVSFNQTHGISVEGTGTQIRIISVDHYHNGKAGSGTNYDLNWTGTATGKVVDSTFDTAIGSGVTTVTASVNNAAGIVDYRANAFPQAGAGGTRFAAGQPGNASFTPADPASTVSGTLVMMGLGSSCAFTPQGSGRVLVTVTGGATTATAAVTGVVGCRYGTGTAPANGVAVTGTRFGAAADVQFKSNGTPATVQTFAFTSVLSLVAGTTYWFDLALDSSNPSDAAQVRGVSMTFDELA
jgi:hypothetical protein